VARPTRSINVSAFVDYALVDSARDRVYLSSFQLPRVEVLALSSMTFRPAISLPGPPGGMDFTASGDSLVVAVPGSRQLAIIDLQDSSSPVSLLTPSIDTSFGRRPVAVAVSSGNMIMFRAENDQNSMAFTYEYELTSGRERLRTDAASLTYYLPIRASADRARLFFLTVTQSPDCPRLVQVYLAATDSFMTPEPAGCPESWASFTISRAPTRILVGSTLSDGNAMHLRTYAPPGTGVTALSQRGDSAYIGTLTGALRMRLADGLVTEEVLLPERPMMLLVVPGADERLLALSGQISLVDLAGVAGASTAVKSRERTTTFVRRSR
jgi:hypothetical protein